MTPHPLEDPLEDLGRTATEERNVADMIDMDGVLGRLAADRPIFHSEADFQHALAWRIQSAYSEAHIRLETRPERGIHLDLLVGLPEGRTAIELKYLAARFVGVVGVEQYELPNRGAHAISRYDFVKDVSRIERCIRSGYADRGWAVALSNDQSYWTVGSKANPVDAAFRLHDGRVLSGLLSWGIDVGAGTTRGREAALAVSGSYSCKWRSYSDVATPNKRTAFRYLALSVVP